MRFRTGYVEEWPGDGLSLGSSGLPRTQEEKMNVAGLARLNQLGETM